MAYDAPVAREALNRNAKEFQRLPCLREGDVKTVSAGAILILTLFVASPVSPQAPTASQPAVTGSAPAPNNYGDGMSWLCRPGRQDACAVDLTTTIVAADGRLTQETWTADPNAAIDCFYV